MDISNLLVEVFMKVMNDSRGRQDFYVFGCSIADLRMEVPRY